MPVVKSVNTSSPRDWPLVPHLVLSEWEHETNDLLPANNCRPELNALACSYLELARGLEPLTPCLQDRCATDCATPAVSLSGLHAPS